MSLVRRKIFYKLIAITGVVFILVFTGLHLWFSHNAADFLEDSVYKRSQGRLKLKIKGLRFNYFTNYIEVRGGFLVTGDTLAQPASYNIKLSKLSLHIGSFWPLLFQQKLLLDSVKVYDPVVDVYRWRKDTASVFEQDDVSIPQELGKMYNSLLDGLEDLGIRRMVIERGCFRFNNRMKPDSRPVVLSNIHFSLIRMADGVDKRDSFVLDKQSVELSTHHQNIELPGGQHHLSFKNFELELFQKRIELDSCTLTALPTANSKNSFRIFFSKLFLIGVDFNAMYTKNLIRADSVYCVEPMMHFMLESPDTALANQKNLKPDAEKIIRDLIGDLDLAFIGVKNAGVRVDINGKKNRSLFNSRKDNFEMHQLRINPDSSAPISIGRFDMLVRDYRLYNEDSSAIFGFDSVHFSNNKIALSNFSVITTPSVKGSHNTRNFLIPRFEMAGLDWYELIFEENLHAYEATLYDPVIYYKGTPRKAADVKANLFQLLKNTDELLSLEKINVLNGRLNVQLPSGTSFLLKNANLSIYSNQLLASKDDDGLKRAINMLSFKTGIVQTNDVIARLEDVRYIDNNLLTAGRLYVSNKNKSLNVSASDIVVNDVLLEEKSQTIIINGLRWKKADVKYAATSAGAKGWSNIVVRNFVGNNTQLAYSGADTKLTTNLELLQAASVDMKKNSAPKIEGFLMNGKHLQFAGKSLFIDAAAYHIEENASSNLKQAQISRITNNDSLSVNLPGADFVMNINSAFQSNIYIDNIHLQNPDISFSKRHRPEDNIMDAKESMPEIRLGSLTAHQPFVHADIYKEDGVSSFNLPRSEKGYIKMNDFYMSGEGITIGNLFLNNESLSFRKPQGYEWGVHKGKVDVELSHIRLLNGSKNLNWSLLLNRLLLERPNSFTTKKGGLYSFEQVATGNIQLSSESIHDFEKLARLNASAWIQTATGQYVDSNITFKWFNAGYDGVEKVLTLDSLMYRPTLSKDSAIAKAPYQKDYITLQSGPVKLTDFNLDRYGSDSIFKAGTISFQHPEINVYRDKTLPFRGGVVRPLPVDLIKKMPFNVFVERINMVNGFITYTELSPKTNKEGAIELTNVNASLSHITNNNLQPGDSLSLSVDAMLLDSARLSLRVKESYTDSLSGFLMTLRMRPTSTLSFINPVLIPLSGIKIASGTIDSLHLRAIGSEYVSLGEMKMFYHDLKIKLLKAGNETRSSFYRNTLSFLANTFVIRKNNNGRSSIVYFERRRNRSFFNYIVKMTFSGMASSAGIKRNKKYMRQYKRELEKSNLPPIRFDDALEKTLETKTRGQERNTKPGTRKNK